MYQLLPHQPVRKTQTALRVLVESRAANYVSRDVFGKPGSHNICWVNLRPLRDCGRVLRVTITATPDHRDEPPPVRVGCEKEVLSSLHYRVHLASILTDHASDANSLGQSSARAFVSRGKTCFDVWRT